jgi:hypothetical protein
MGPPSLDAAAIERTAGLLQQRIERRFPGSGLAGIAVDLERVAQRTRERAAWIARPILPLRVAVVVLIGLIGAGLASTMFALGRPKEPLEVTQFIQVLEAGINDVVLVAAGIFFLTTLESRLKRSRALAALRELRAIAHIIDMHQLTKDPEWVLKDDGKESGVLPPREMTRFELSRYLDYCSEMLSITGKIAALYIQDFDDDGALAAVNEVESLTTGLSRKIWQKLMILYALGPETPAQGPTATLPA